MQDLTKESCKVGALLLALNSLLVAPSPPSSPLPQIVSLNLSSNRLSDLPPALLASALPYLSTINLKDCGLTEEQVWRPASSSASSPASYCFSSFLSCLSPASSPAPPQAEALLEALSEMEEVESLNLSDNRSDFTDHSCFCSTPALG